MDQRFYRILFVSFSFILFCILLAYSAHAEPIAVTDLGVDNSKGAVSVGFSIVVHDEAPLLEILQDGGDYEVRCTGKLYHRRAGFWDEFLSEASYVCLMTGKPIARECLLQDHRGSHTVDFSTLRKDLNQFWSHLSLPMGSWEQIQRNRAYKVVLSFKITRTNISQWIRKPLFFVSWDFVPEVAYELNFDF